MEHIKTSLVILILFLLAISCSQKKNNAGENKEKEVIANNYNLVEEVFAHADSLVGLTINVKGIVEHVCKHGGKRFKILSQEGNQELKISLGDKFNSADESIIGQEAYVTGELAADKMDAEMVKQWEKRIRENHKGQEDTKHFKEEIEFVQSIHEQIITGEIPFYLSYYVQADSYTTK